MMLSGLLSTDDVIIKRRLGIFSGYCDEGGKEGEGVLEDCMADCI